MKIFRTDEADHAVHQERIERASNCVCTRFQRELVDSMMSPRGKRASLPSFEIHDIRALPGHIPPAMMFKNLVPAFTQHRQCNAETAICGFSASDGLEKKIHGRSEGERRKLCCDVRKAASLGWYLIGVDEASQTMQDCPGRLNRI